MPHISQQMVKTAVPMMHVQIFTLCNKSNMSSAYGICKTFAP